MPETVRIFYLSVGMITEVAAFLHVTRYVSVQPRTLGTGFEIEVLTAVLLGGISFMSGKGTIAGAALGVVLLGVLSAGLQQVAVLPATQLRTRGSPPVVDFQTH